MHKPKQFGSFRWRGNSLQLDYRLKRGGARQRPVYATLRTGSVSERRQLEEAARKYLNDIETSIRKGTIFDNSENAFPTYKQAALFYWEKFESKKEYILADNGSYASEFFKVETSIKYFDGKHVDEIKREDIKSYRAHLRELGVKAKRPWGDAYINRFVSKVGQVYHQIINQEYWRFESAPEGEMIRYGKIDSCVKIENPVHGLSKLYEKETSHFIPTIDQFLKAWDFLLPYQKLLAIIGIHTGLRKRNVVCLKWGQVDLFGRKIKIDSHKGNKPPLIVRLHPEVIDVLKICSWSRKISEYVICKSDGKPYKDFHVTWNKAWSDAGFERVRFRDLRTIYASWRIEEGIELGLLQRALAHTSPTTTGKIYNRTQRASEIILKTQRPLFGCDQASDQPVTKSA